ncbi:expressed unknown protein [Seminavis robusta]|uniref:DUF4440 domain-containing protein n=1 Tax=Seminavis robusta TaxID=568900 RepID=A0A9N8ELD9_9STRA|nr:expressed unknown protein [Seminavis robusta]|eukprot:Sro1276_g258560.1 n/a (138) ;mRNA; r:11459-11872
MDSTKQEIQSAVQAWLQGLDNGNLDEMVKYTDDSVIICNEHTKTTVGVQALKDKYGPLIAAMNFESTCTVQELLVFGDFAFWVGRFTANAKSKVTGESLKKAEGRLVMALRKVGGTWKVFLDVDNNDETDKKAEAAA